MLCATGLNLDENYNSQGNYKLSQLTQEIVSNPNRPHIMEKKIV